MSRSTQVGINIKKRFKFKKPKKGAGKEFIGKLSQGLMMPIAVLPIAGLLLGIGAAIATNAGTNEALKVFGLFMKNAGDFVFGNLSVLFAVAIAIAFTKDAGVAALSALIAWISFNGMQSALIIPEANGTFSMLYWTGLPAAVFGTNVGINSLQTSVFGGAIVGSIVAALYNRFYQIQMPKILGFFSGTRFVPIISLIAMIPLALIFAMIWPGIGLGLNYIGIGLGTLGANGGINAFIFGYIERALVPTGLHHAFYSPLWYTSAGGSMNNVNDISPFIHVGGQVYAVTGVMINGERFMFADHNITDPRWIDIIKQLNNGTFNTDEWGGDQRLWFALNSNLINKQLILGGYTGGGGSQGDLYTMTFTTFAENTWNIGFSNIGAVVPTNSALTYEAIKGAPVAFSHENFKVAFPGVNPGQYEQGKFPFMIFGLPAAAGAMVMAAPKTNRKYAMSIIGSAALTSFLTGITEPLEFTFLFLAPWLYWGVHAVLCAFSFWFMSLFGANLGMTFSGGFIDFTIYGIVPDALGSNVHSWAAVIIGIVYIPIYFMLFYFLVKRFDLKTPGRGGELITKKQYFASKDKNANQQVDESITNNKTDFTHTQYTAYKLIDAFGGFENIGAVNACITKLRVNFKEKNKINEALIKELGAQGIIYPSEVLAHAIFGTDSEPIKTQMNIIIKREINIEALKKFVEMVDNHEEPKENNVSNNVNNLTESENKQLLDEMIIYAPMSGTLVKSSEINDKTFADELIGQGAAIKPNDSHIVSPWKQDATVSLAFNTGHAYVVEANGIKIMIHIGIDTVSLNSNNNNLNDLVGFKPYVKTEDKINSFAKLVDADFDLIKNKNLDTITPIILLSESENLSKYNLTVIPQYGSEIKVNDPLFKLTLKY
ncbi:PTS transporter subunit IIABC [Mycoplasmoides pirum]|uniref:PTS transporter subunit IIABC n=1 Tax=Mycoplasmoides pirum TaxID=2122 RepID=UPI000486AF50|nr:glucose PTS transporter subunit IIA [Mycoplasmoides pirum]